MMLKLMIDEVPYKEKPAGAEIGKIQNRLGQQSALKEVTLEQLCSCIEKGYTICPAVMDGGMKNEDWRQQQLICIDVDSDAKKGIIIPLEESLAILEKNKIDVLAHYPSFHDSKEEPRYRILFMLDKPISSVEKRDFIVEGLTELLKGDHSCTNPARIFFGTDGQTKKVTVVNANATITLDDVIRIYKPSSPNNYNKNDELMQMVHEFDRNFP